MTTVLRDSSLAEAENSFNLLLTLLRKQPAATGEPQFAKIIEFLTSDTSAKQQLRLRMYAFSVFVFSPHQR